MTTAITLGKVGRVVIPKQVREQMNLAPGDTLELESDGEKITLRPARPHATLKKEYGVWVYQGQSSAVAIPDLIDREREKRLRELTPRRRRYVSPERAAFWALTSIIKSSVKLLAAANDDCPSGQTHDSARAGPPAG